MVTVESGLPRHPLVRIEAAGRERQAASPPSTLFGPLDLSRVPAVAWGTGPMGSLHSPLESRGGQR